MHLKELHLSRAMLYCKFATKQIIPWPHSVTEKSCFWLTCSWMLNLPVLLDPKLTQLSICHKRGTIYLTKIEMRQQRIDYPKLIAAISYFTLACILNRLVVRVICLVCEQHERDMTKMEEQLKANCHARRRCDSILFYFIFFTAANSSASFCTNKKTVGRTEAKKIAAISTLSREIHTGGEKALASQTNCHSIKMLFSLN